ncbi:MAG: hypothetical protein K2M06_02020 [Muribaculaceae bacterium]|nr:hypothetical protein [Muribaculaceae bacterium]
MKEDIELNKLSILLNAIKAVKEEEPDLYAELKEAAWNVLHENPGIEFNEWQQTLLDQYPAEVVDALGNNPFEVYPALADLWDSNDYEDPDTGECHTFMQWADYFATDASVELYDMLADARREIKRFKASKNQKQ